MGSAGIEVLKSVGFCAVPGGACSRVSSLQLGVGEAGGEGLRVCVCVVASSALQRVTVVCVLTHPPRQPLLLLLLLCRPSVCCSACLAAQKTQGGIINSSSSSEGSWGLKAAGCRCSCWRTTRCYSQPRHCYSQFGCCYSPDCC